MSKSTKSGKSTAGNATQPDNIAGLGERIVGGHVPVGFASWAYLSEEAEARMLQGVRKLGPADWKSGDRLWLMDLIIPFGGMQEAAKELRETVLKGKKVKSLQPAPDGSGMAVVEW